MTTLALEPTPLKRDATVIGLVGVAHCISHFSQLLLPPLFPWLKDAFAVSYAQLGFLLTVFFVVSCVGLALPGLASFGYALASSYTMLVACAALAGVGNGVFHPVDYTLINRKV